MRRGRIKKRERGKERGDNVLFYNVERLAKGRRVRNMRWREGN